MSEFQQRDQIEPNSSPAQPAEMVEFEGVVIDTATQGVRPARQRRISTKPLSMCGSRSSG